MKPKKTGGNAKDIIGKVQNPLIETVMRKNMDIMKGRQMAALLAKSHNEL